MTRHDDVLVVDAAASTVTLPSAVGIKNSVYTVKKTNAGAGNVTIGCSGAQTIDGAATYTIANQWQYVTVISDDANWLVVENN